MRLGNKLQFSRFRFGLKSVFIVLTVCCLWFGWQVRLVREREQLWQFVKSVDPEVNLGPISLNEDRQLPYVWKLLGAKYEPALFLRRDHFSQTEIDRVITLFPESQIHVAPKGAGEFQRRN